MNADGKNVLWQCLRGILKWVEAENFFAPKKRKVWTHAAACAEDVVPNRAAGYWDDSTAASGLTASTYVCRCISGKHNQRKTQKGECKMFVRYSLLFWLQWRKWDMSFSSFNLIHLTESLHPSSLSTFTEIQYEFLGGRPFKTLKQGAMTSASMGFVCFYMEIPNILTYSLSRTFKFLVDLSSVM